MLKYLKSAGLLAGLVAWSLPLTALAATSGSNGSHDPSRMIACENKVYIYSTGGGAKSSTDGLNWQSLAAPPWNRSLANNQGIWAPDVIFLNGKYLLYGSMWNDGKASRITLLSSPSLNPDSPKYAWKDEGTVIEGPAGVSHSVIDPAPALDTAGNLYVVWGGGYPFPNEADAIFLTRMDNATGLALTTDPGYKPPAQPGYPLLKGHKEGPYIHYRNNYYYLFWQTGGCCSGASSTYTIHMTRAADIKGPYTGDRTFYASKGSIHGPGHMGIYNDCGMERFTYHYYPDTGGSVIGHNELVWGADGWPSVGPEATTAVKICDAVGVGGSGGSGGATPGGGAAGAGSGGRAGSSSGGNGGVSGSSVEEPPVTAGTSTSAGTASVGGSAATAGRSSVAGTGGTSDDQLIPNDADNGEIACACSVPGGLEGRGSASWLASAVLALSVWRRRRSGTARSWNMRNASLFALALVCAPARASAAEPVDTELPKHNVTWTTPSVGITESMPIGNGRLAALVWAEKGGDLMVSLATGDSWDENARSIRTGNVRFALSPNPFANGKPFQQVLDYKNAEITFKVGDSPAVFVRVWVDANQPVVHVEASAATAFQLKVTPELWRTARQDISQTTPWKDFIHVAKDVSTNTSSLKVELMPDVWVTTLPGKVGWYHRNETSHWQPTLTNQSIDAVAFGVKDPLTLRTMGATVQGTNLAPSGHDLVAAEAQPKFRVDIAAHTNITERANTWVAEMDAVGTGVFAQDIETLRAAHAGYWDRFWNRSYVFVTGNTDADNVTKGWIAARYLMGCQSRAEGPLEFNGGLFSFQNDVKLWHDYTQANQQFAHWSMLPSGDFDLVQSWFDMLLKSLPVGRAKTKASWNHDGAMFAEHMILYGPQSGSHYGWDRTGRAPGYELAAATRLLYGGVVENAVMMLDTYEYTGDADFAKNKLVPFASEIVKWYDQHWQKVGGKIRMSPIYSGERDKNVTNSMVDVAGLTKLVGGLLALPETVTTQAQRDDWKAVQGALPALPISGGRLRPAEDLAVGTDTNNQNLAPIFPMRMIGPGKPDLQIGVDSYNSRTGQAPRDGTEAWRHDAAHAAYLGLANEARTQVIGRFTRYKYRYQGFVNGAPDGDHCIEPIAVGKIGLQAMLMHPGAGKTLNLLNAWPSGWNAQFKLWGPQKTWVAGSVTGGSFTSLTVSPKARVPDILIGGAAPTGVTITGSDEDGGYVAPTLTPDASTPPIGTAGSGGTGNIAGSTGTAGAVSMGGDVANGGASAGPTSGGVAPPGGGAGVANPANASGAAGPNASGCGCRLGPHSGWSGGWLLSLAALWVVRTLRRPGRLSPSPLDIC